MAEKRFPVNKMMSEKKLVAPKIVIVKLSSIGDIIHTLPVLCAIKENLPESRISWIVEERAKNILIGHECLEEVIVVDTKKWRKEIREKKKRSTVIKEMKELKKKLKEKSFDMVIDLQGLIKSGIVTWACGGKTRIGFHPKACREKVSAIFTNKWVLPPLEEMHIIEKNLEILKTMGLHAGKIEYKLPIKEKQKKWAKEWLEKNNIGIKKKNKKIVIIHPGTTWQSKCWLVERYVELIDALKKREIKVIMSGGPGEKVLLSEINKKLEETIPEAIDINIVELMAIIENCDVMVAADTGPLHIAAALGTKAIGIFGPSDPKKNGPYGEGHRVLCANLECSGCRKRSCNDLKCMREIKVKEVMDVLEE